MLFGEDLRGMTGDADVGVEGPLVRTSSPISWTSGTKKEDK